MNIEEHMGHKDKNFLPDQKKLAKDSLGSRQYAEGQLINTKNPNKTHSKEPSKSKEWVECRNTSDKGMEKDWEERHDKFQGHNPMLMTDFEKSCVAQEKQERYMSKVRYGLGIQGVDGGRFPRSQT